MSTLEPTQPKADAALREHSSLRQWILDHDDRWLFIITYITLAVVLSIWISLFWLVAVVAAHGALEWVRHQHFDARPRGIVIRVLWELKLDIALIILALVVTVYMEFILGLAGLSGVARAGLSSGARFAGWQRAIRGVLLSVDDAAQLGRAVVRGNDDDEQGDAERARCIWGGWTQPWSFGDWLSLSLSAIGVVLIALCPMVTDHTVTSMWAEILHELHPFPPQSESG